MNKYLTIRQLGDGTYGSVILGRNLESGELVAIKKMKRKFSSWKECLNLREVKSLQKLKHANVITLKEVILENEHLYFVFEYMKENLYQLMTNRTQLFPESAVRNIMFQILQGLVFIHKQGFFHRDLKPENLLCMGPELVKIADFGLVREIRSRPPYTDYVSTRWYRAPELLLRSTYYSSPIDQWAVGCIMAELYTLRPLFPGSSEIDTIFKICQVFGTPKKDDWPVGYQLASAMNFRWPQCVPSNLRTLIPTASPEAIHLMTDLLQWDAKKRPTSAQALRYSYFHVGQALGTPQQILEQGRPKPALLPPQQPAQPQPLLLKPVLPSQPHVPSSRPLQQIQPSPVSATAQAAAYQRRTDLVREQQPKHILKQEQSEGTPPSHLPFITDKNVQRKPTRQESENTNLLRYPLKPKVGRQRWGHSTENLKGDDWDDHKEAESTPTSILGKSLLATEKSRQGEEAMSIYTDVLDFSRPKVKEDAALNLNKSSAYQDSSRTASVKHYLRQSRYFPGISTNKNVSLSSAKDLTGGQLWGTSSIPFGGTLPSRGAHGGYVPSFYKKDVGSAGHRGLQGPSVESAASNYATWRSGRSQTNQPTNKSTSGLLPRPPVQTIHGRTDWYAKYGPR